jgi:hypothetical protein
MYQTSALILFLAGCTTSIGQSTGSVTDPPVDAGTDPSANRVFLQSLLDQGGDRHACHRREQRHAGVTQQQRDDGDRESWR